MLTFLRLAILVPCLATVAAVSHDAAVGTLSGGGAAGATLTLCACAALWRGLNVLEPRQPRGWLVVND